MSRREETAAARTDAGETHAQGTSLAGASAAMFLIFVGFSSGQFHSYLFESRGMRAMQIGVLIMAGQIAAICSPFLQVGLIRRFRGPRLPLILVIAVSAAALMCLPWARGFWPLLGVFCLYSFCDAGLSPLNAACTLDALRGRGHSIFFRIRSLGTLGFLIGCIISVFFTSLRDLPLLYAGFAAAMFVALAAVARSYRDPEHAAHFTGGPAGPAASALEAAPTFSRALALLARPRTFKLLLVLGVMNFANAMATGVQGNYLVDRWHEGQRTISMAWVVSTGCEVPLMLLCAWALRRFGLKYVLGFGIFGTLLKLAGLAAAGEVWQYYFALTMHGCFFSGALTGFSVFLDRHYPRAERAALQSLAPVFYAAIPSALAGLADGLIWHAFSLRAVYLAAGGLALFASGSAFLILRNMGKAPDPA